MRSRASAVRWVLVVAPGGLPRLSPARFLIRSEGHGGRTRTFLNPEHFRGRVPLAR